MITGSVILLVISLGAILLSAELFTNSIEWVGEKLHLSEGMVGSVLAAVGTALPETSIAIVAVFAASGTAHAVDVGVGAILGAPFMLATLAMFVTGVGVLIFTATGRRKSNTMQLDKDILSQDFRYFLMTYSMALAVAFVPFYAVKVVVAIALVGLYAYYVYRHAIREAQATEGRTIPPLRIGKLVRPVRTIRADPPVEEVELAGTGEVHVHVVEPHMALVIVQLIVSLALMAGGSYVFVSAVSAIAGVLGFPALVLSLIIAPIATELPEKFNSIIWVRSGKDTLAMGNISGAMVFQSCIPVSFGILFTPWAALEEGLIGFVSAGIAIAATLVLVAGMRRRGLLSAWTLLLGGFWYAAYIGFVFLMPL